MEEDRDKRKNKFCINDNVDVLIEILKMLEGQSLGVAACVCKLWCAISRDESMWENLCFRRQPDGCVRAVVAALGGYRRLYVACVRPVLMSRQLLVRNNDVVWARNEVELLLSLFCVDYYERVFLGDSGEGGGRHGGDSPPPSSLLFLCKAVNV